MKDNAYVQQNSRVINIKIFNTKSLFFISLILFSNNIFASIIMQIEFVGNDKTKEYVFLQEMQSKVGDLLDIKKVEKDIQAIMDLDIFREVEYFLYAADDLVEDHVKLVISVHEKYYLFILPELRVDEEDKKIRYGVLAYWDNIAGSNQSLRLKVREYGDTLGTDDVRQELTYSIPRIYGSPFRLDLFTEYRQAVVDNFVDAPQSRDESKFGFDLFRWYHLKNRSRGWYLGAGLYKEERNNEAFLSGEISRPDFDGTFWGLRIGYKDIGQYLYNRRGKDYGYVVDTTKYLFEAEQNHTKHLLFYRSYYRLKSKPLNNLNIQLQLGVSEGDYLGDTEFYLGGRDLRGYEKDLYIGNAMLLLNMEYLVPFTDDPAFRYGLLFDLGNTYERADLIDLSRLHPAVGVGFRWKLAAFVKVNIRMDIGYAIDTGGTNILINSRHLF